MAMSFRLGFITACLMLYAAHAAAAGAQQMGAGFLHTLWVKSDGTLWAWGDNDYGQLGDGTTTDRLLPVQVGSDDDWVAISAGYWHSLGLKSDGSLWGWGGNMYGQLGDGTTGNRLIPVRIGTANDWVFISAGYGHTLALKANGTLWAWGWNSFGVLGDGTGSDRLLPVQIGSDKTWAFVSAGGFHSMAITANGELWTWGRNDFGQLGDGTTTFKNFPIQVGTDNRWAFVSAGGYHSIAIHANGSLWAWGDNTYGQLGDGTTTGRSSPVRIGLRNDWVWVPAGGYYTMGQRVDGTIWAWGNNGFGQLGDNTFTAKSVPTQIGSERQWVAIAAHDHSLGLKSDGTLWAWGANRSGELGNGETISRRTPVQIAAHPKDTWLSAAGGIHFSVGITSEGTLWSWGYNQFGQLGDGTTEDKALPVQIGTANDWVTVSGGYLHGLAIKADATLWAWGDNGWGQLGDGSTLRKLAPVQIGSDSDWAAVAGSALYHTLALKADGTLWGWGRNDLGQLGLGTTSTREVTPVLIGSDTDWVAIAAGGHHSLALKADGTLWAWGLNDYGQVGDGTVTTRTSPVQIGTDTSWRLISAGYIHSVARKANGTLWVWGGNHQGELGLGDFTARPTPTQVGTDNDWTAIVGKNDTSHAIKSSGVLWGFGDSTFGQLGDGGNSRKLSPVQIGLDDDWVSVARAFYHALAIKSDGTLWAWGQNNHGQLGDGTTVDKNSPILVVLPTSAALRITPSTGFASSGNYGGPFSPQNKSYTLKNTTGAPIDWSASVANTWAGVSATGGTLAPDQSITVTVLINGSAATLAPGAYNDSVTFTNVTDGSGNTTRLVSLSVVTPVPDLVIPTLTSPSPLVSPGQAVRLSETTKNQGTGATQAQTVTRFYWSINSIYDASDTEIGERTVPALAPGASSGPINTDVTIPSTAGVGSYYIIARSDAAGSQAETSETNNTRYITVRIGVDLVVSSMTGPTTPVAPGQTIDVSATTRNQGTAPTNGSTITRFYWSSNSTYDASDTPMGQRSVISLNAGGSVGPVTTSVTIPSSASGGSYYIIARADAENSESETSETNNTRFAVVGVGADLIVPTLTGPTAAVVPGQAITVTDTTRNQGTASTDGTTVTKFYWSTNSTYDTSDLALGERVVATLPAGGTSGPANTSVTIPTAAAGGTYYVIARADAANSQSETSETNNTRFLTIRIGTDLLIPTLTGPTAPVAPGQQVTLSETTRNQGSVATAAATVTRFYWSTNTIFDVSDTPLAERTVGVLGAGASSGPVNTSVTIPATASDGSYYIIARADATNAEAETSETNNTRYVSVGVGRDLVVSALTGPTAAVAAGQTITVFDTTRNQGTAATAGGSVTMLYWSTNSVWDASDTPLAERGVEPLDAQTSSGPAGTSVTVPGTAAVGTYYVIARADANNTESETSETNNTRYLTVRIGVDLVIPTLTGPTTPVAPGQEIVVSETTRNQGSVATTGTTVTRFYWSTNTTFDASDSPLNEHIVGVLGAGATSGVVNTSVTIPATANAGTYYIIALADAGTSESETSETNNTRYRAVNVSF
jgi:alpha-tubulin suppressor-like RCC1 family protein